MATEFVKAMLTPTANHHIPVNSSGDRLQVGAVKMDVLLAPWLDDTIKAERPLYEHIGQANRERCRSTVRELRKIAEPVLSERFYTLGVDSKEHGAAALHNSVITLMHWDNSEISQTFQEILTLRMTKHLLAHEFTSTESELPAILGGKTPTDICLLGRDRSGRYHDSRKLKHNDLILAGKLIAEIEGLIIDLANFSREWAVSKTSIKGISLRMLTSGMPDAMHVKHWDVRDAKEDRILQERADARAARAKDLAKANAQRISAARKLALSESEILIQTTFSQSRRGVSTQA